jgi:hypothetical protein
MLSVIPEIIVINIKIYTGIVIQGNIASKKASKANQAKSPSNGNVPPMVNKTVTEFKYFFISYSYEIL